MTFGGAVGEMSRKRKHWGTLAWTSEKSPLRFDYALQGPIPDKKF